MAKTRPYRDLLLERLANPEVARHYLNDALDESLDAFLKALETVAQARRVSPDIPELSTTGEDSEESLAHERNPSLARLSSQLNAFGLKLSIALQPAPDAAPISGLKGSHLPPATSHKAGRSL